MGKQNSEGPGRTVDPTDGPSRWLMLACAGIALLLALQTPFLSQRLPFASLSAGAILTNSQSNTLFEIQLDGIVENVLQDRTLEDLDDIAAVAHHTRTLKKLAALVSGSDDNTLPAPPTRSGNEDVIRRAVVDISQHLYPWLFPTLQYQTILELRAQTHDGGKGIVIPVGRAYVRWAAHLIMTLREVLHCHLPIEIVYAGGQDLPPLARTYLESLGPNITFLDVKGRFNERVVDMPGGWAIKPFAIMASRFREVILIDADVIFFESPELGFTYKEYQETGSLFFKDRQIWEPDEDNLKWVQSLLRRSSERIKVQSESSYFRRLTAHEMESGVVFLDKYKSFYALLVMCHMNQKRKREDLMYKMFHGEKESYWLAMAATSTPFAWAEGYAGAMGLTYARDSDTPAIPSDADRICTRSILHSTTRNGTRPWWFNGSIVKHKDPVSPQYNGVEAWSLGSDGVWDSSEWDKTGTACFIVTKKEGVREFTKEVTEKFNALIQVTSKVDYAVAEVVLAIG